MLVLRTQKLWVDADDTGSLLAHVLDNVSARVPLWVYLRDREPARGETAVSAVARAIEQHPSLEPLRQTKKTARYQVLASLPDKPDKKSARRRVARKLAVGIADSIPRSLPFFYSNFVVGPVAALWNAPGPAPALREIGMFPSNTTAPASIVVRSSWGSTRRDLELEVHVVEAAPEREVKRLPPLPDKALVLVEALGRVRAEKVRVIKDGFGPIRSVKRAAGLVEGVNLGAVALPFPELEDDDIWPPKESFGWFKAELGARFPSYRYESKRCKAGRWVLTKRTSRLNELQVCVYHNDSGTTSALLEVGGPLWNHHFNLPASTARSVDVATPETLSKVCQNWAASVSMLERDLIPKLEALYEPGCAWYSSGA